MGIFYKCPTQRPTNTLNTQMYNEFCGYIVIIRIEMCVCVCVCVCVCLFCYTFEDQMSPQG